MTANPVIIKTMGKTTILGNSLLKESYSSTEKGKNSDFQLWTAVFLECFKPKLNK